MEVAKVSNSAKRSADASPGRASPPPSSPLVLPGAAPPEDKAINSASSFHVREPSPSLYPDVLEETTLTLPQPTDTPAASPETQHSVLDACPHDVLYISDLITFSSRFCGSNRPLSSQLVFGSSQEMVEVIMELITTTHWGRGFALLFHYHNLTEPGGSRHVSSPAAGKVDSLLAAVSGAAFFAMVLTSALCVIFRPKLCPKRGSSCSSSNSEVPEGVQNTGAEVSELQLMAENQINMEATTEADDDSPPETGTADNSENAEVDLSCSGLTELDLEGRTAGRSSPTLTWRPRRMQTFSDSSISNASYPLTQSAQRQRRLNSISNLRRSRFTGPCFGLLSAPDPAKTPGVPQPEASPSESGPSSSSPSTQHRAESGQAGKRREGDHVSVPVFAISEEEDRQPLVPCEHLGQRSASAALNGLVKGTAAGSNSLNPPNQRARPEWRPWGSQASGGVGPLSPTQPVAAGGGEPPLRRATVLCSVTNQM
ncbi:unnamed protein product [Tetraodon nigroviridis]|uniref:(spotted green pufferfish) hypothetical protein n=1 Tax=Tetraodon nigroviridis TaxID=99883 RepID=Q4RPJ0_TETNG|nr:unnamed protein product [Tetraodon nigroviridis]